MTEAFEDVTGSIAELPQIKLFGKWPSEDVNHSDMSLAVSMLLFGKCQIQNSFPSILPPLQATNALE